MATVRIGEQFIQQLRAYANTLASTVIANIGEAGVEHIRQRTKSGYDKNGSPLKSYSTKYARRKGQDNVDLYGNSRVSRHGGPRMLDSLYVAEGSGTTVDTALGGGQIRGPVLGQTQSIRDVNVQIAFNDSGAALRAYGHISGSATGKVRDFMGLEDLWVQESVDKEARGFTPKFAGTEVVTVRAL